MDFLVKSGAALLILLAVVGMVGNAASSLANEARGVLDEHAGGLEDLQGRWAALGVPGEVTAPVSAIREVAYSTLDLPEELTETATDILSQGLVTETETISVTEPLISTPLVTDAAIIAESAKFVALGALQKTDGGPVFLIQKSEDWEAGDEGFYVHVRFVDFQGNESAFCTERLDSDRRKKWALDVSEVEVLPEGWAGIGVVTVHDGPQAGLDNLSDEYRICVASVEKGPSA